jgi:hypothetical protein
LVVVLFSLTRTTTFYREETASLNPAVNVYQLMVLSYQRPTFGFFRKCLSRSVLTPAWKGEASIDGAAGIHLIRSLSRQLRTGRNFSVAGEWIIAV